MTGYGQARGQVGGLQVAVELRSLNSKFLEFNLRLPLQFRDRELELRADIGKLCGAFATPHVAIRDWAHLRRELALDRPGVRVLEVRTDRARDSAHRKRAFRG